MERCCWADGQAYVHESFLIMGINAHINELFMQHRACLADVGSGMPVDCRWPVSKAWETGDPTHATEIDNQNLSTVHGKCARGAYNSGPFPSQTCVIKAIVEPVQRRRLRQLYV